MIFTKIRCISFYCPIFLSFPYGGNRFVHHSWQSGMQLNNHFYESGHQMKRNVLMKAKEDDLVSMQDFTLYGGFLRNLPN